MRRFVRKEPRARTRAARVETRLQLPAESWRLEYFDSYAVADRAVVVLLYEFSQDTARAWVAHCWLTARRRGPARC